MTSPLRLVVEVAFTSVDRPGLLCPTSIKSAAACAFFEAESRADAERHHGERLEAHGEKDQD